jgi:glycosyltransferase involved in cell wall biosynthesis
MAQTTTSNHKIAVLIPCFNEQKTIKKVVLDFQNALPDAMVFVFDNNSTDDSAKIAQESGAIVIGEKRQGKGFVVNSMFKKVQADFYIMVDGDDTYPVEYVGQLLQPLIHEEADMVVGHRLTTYSTNAFRPLHYAGNRLICQIINAVFSSNIRDPMSGYRAFTREVVKTLPIIAMGFDVETEITLQLLYRRFKIKEIEIPYRERPEGSFSKLRTFRDGLLVILKIFSIIQAYKPLTFFGTIGILLLFIGLIGVLTVIKGFLSDQSMNDLIKLLFASGCFITGFVSIAIGLILHTVNVRLLEISNQLSKLV